MMRLTRVLEEFFKIMSYLVEACVGVMIFGMVALIVFTLGVGMAEVVKTIFGG